MRVLESVGHLDRDPHRLVYGELPLPVQPLAERFAFHVGHHEVEQPVRLARVVERQDVRMLEPGDDLEIPGLRVAPSHRLEDPVGARLEGEVQVGADPGEVAEGLPQAPVDVLLDGNGMLAQLGIDCSAPGPPNPLCADILSVTGVGDYFETFPDVNAAVGSFLL